MELQDNQDKEKAVQSGVVVLKAKKAPRKTKATRKVKVDVNALPHGLGVKAMLLDDQNTHADANGVATGGSSGESATQQFDIDGKEEVVGKNTAGVKPVSTNVTTITAASPIAATDSIAITVAPLKLPKKKKGKRATQPKPKLGLSPYPDLQRPTKEECYNLSKILSEAHGEVQAPENIPVPSRTVAGCGEVKFVLEALVRTHLSAHTSMSNANRAIQGLLKRYTTFKSGPCAGSVDWNEVRTSSQGDLELAIRGGGMAPTKSKAIKKMLDMVYEENQARRRELREKAAMVPAAEDAGEEVVSKVEISENSLAGDTKAAIMGRFANEVLLESDNILTLDYIHTMDPSEAFSKLMTYPGIGIKTAACVLLFCMQRPFFAVDTHVWRICKWLGWVPEKADRNNTFWHCDVKVPDDLKYSLHQLMIAHGKSCGRCRASTSENSEAWAEGCPIEDLVKRTGVRKGGEEETKPKSRKRKSKDASDDEGNEGGQYERDETTKLKKRSRRTNGKATARQREEKAETCSPSQQPGAVSKVANTEIEQESATPLEPKTNRSLPKQSAAAMAKTQKKQKKSVEGKAGAHSGSKQPRPKANTAAKRSSVRAPASSKAKKGLSEAGNAVALDSYEDQGDGQVIPSIEDEG